MLGDILLIGDIHKELGAKLLEYILADREKKGDDYKYVVAIAGESGSGKSEMGHVIANYLKNKMIRAKLLHLDNYYKIPPLLRHEWRITHEIDSVGIDEIDWRKLNQNIQDFKEESESMLPCVDIIPQQVDKLITDFKKINILVIEGLYAINAENVDLNIFIDLTYHETKMAQLVRDKEIFDEFRLKILEKEHQDVSSLKSKANLMVNKNFEIEINGSKS